MVATVRTSLLLLALIGFLAFAQLPGPHMEPELLSSVAGAVKAVLSRVSYANCSFLLLTDGRTSSITVLKVMDQLQPSWGVGVFEVAADGQDGKMTQEQLSRLVGQARRLLEVSWCVTVVVVSDDPAFLGAFAQGSLKGRLLVWPTRLLALTRLPLPELQSLHTTFSMSNSVLLVVDKKFASPRCAAYVYIPYTPSSVRPLMVASWTPQKGLTFNSHIPLFPEKFSKFPHKPELVVAMNARILTKAVMKEDETAPGGKRLWFEGDQVDMLDYLAQGFNFTYTFVQPPDKGSGRKLKNGTWSGVVGMVKREEAHFAVGPFSITASRSEVVDLTTPVDMSYVIFMGGRGRPEVDPWGFLLPLTALVWVAILAALVVVIATTFLMYSYLSYSSGNRVEWQKKSSDFIRVLLQQDFSEAGDWLWERLVLGVWMLTMLVLTRSYAGNLVSYMAVRHIPEPYETLRDVLDDPSASVIWQRDSSMEQYIREKKSGILRELARMEGGGRIMRKAVDELYGSLDTLVRQGHILTVYEDFLVILIGQHFSKTGWCDFYKLKDKIKPSMAGMVVPKDSPLLQHFNDKALAMSESGLYNYWAYSAIPNYTACLNPPSRISVSTSLSMTNFWGIFVVLLVGHLISLALLLLEFLYAKILK